MAIRHLRLALGLFFLLAGVTLLTLQLAKPEIAARINPPLQIYIGAMFALVLSGWNLMKWYAGWVWFHQQATPVRRPLQSESDTRRDEEPNPDFDFSTPEEKK